MLEVSEIKRLIEEDFNSPKKQLARVGQRYYEGDHDIKGYKMFYYNADGDLCEDKTRSNERISHPFFTELVDQLPAFILSSPERPIYSDAEGLQDHLDRYFDDDFYSELSDVIGGSYAKGFDYLHAYKVTDENEPSKTKILFKYTDAMGIVEVRENDTDSHSKHFIYWYIDRIDKNKKEIRRISVHDEKQTWFYVQSGQNGKIELDKDVQPNPRSNIIYKNIETGALFSVPGGLGFMPFFRLDYNKKQFSGLKPIKGLIDDYDLMQCGLSNNLQDFDTPVHVVKGFEGDNLDELQQNIKTKKVVGVGEGGGIEVLTVNVPYEARKTKADEDEKNIYRFGMGLNTQSLKDTNATTNLAIQMAYTLLELKAKMFENRIKQFLRPILKVVVDDINAQNKTQFNANDVKIEFKHEVTVNETENIANEQVKATTQGILLNNILNVASYIGDEETLKEICDVLEIDYEELKIKLESQANEEIDVLDAQNMLDAVEPEEDFDEEEVEDDEESEGISEGEKQTQQAVLDMLDELLKDLD